MSFSNQMDAFDKDNVFEERIAYTEMETKYI